MLAGFMLAALAAASCTSSPDAGLSGPTGVLGSAQEPQQPEPKPLTEQQIADLRSYCPKTVLRAGTETLRLYPEGVTEEDDDAELKLRFQANILEVARECNYSGDILGMRVGFAGRVINGPTGDSGAMELPVRIAVTRGEEVLYSQLHTIPVTIHPGSTVATFRFVDSNVAIAKPEHENILIYVGFDEGPYDNP